MDGNRNNRLVDQLTWFTTYTVVIFTVINFFIFNIVIKPRNFIVETIVSMMIAMVLSLILVKKG